MPKPPMPCQPEPTRTIPQSSTRSLDLRAERASRHPADQGSPPRSGVTLREDHTIVRRVRITPNTTGDHWNCGGYDWWGGGGGGSLKGAVDGEGGILFDKNNLLQLPHRTATTATATAAIFNSHFFLTTTTTIATATTKQTLHNHPTPPPPTMSAPLHFFRRAAPQTVVLYSYLFVSASYTNPHLTTIN